MPDLQIGDFAPDFSLPADNGETLTLSDMKGRNIVLYFYPKDDTPGCTKEACFFRDEVPAFDKLNAAIIGISKDSTAKHQKFKDKHNLNFTLLSDESGEVCEAYGTWVEKSMYGKTYMGIDRATFLIDEEGKIAQIWRKVKVPGHVEAVKEALEGTKKAA